MSTATAKHTLFNTTRDTVRRTRRAYIGAHVMAFEFASKRASLRVSQAKALGVALVAKGEAVEHDARALASVATDTLKDKVGGILPTSKVKTIDVKATRVAKKPKPSAKVKMTTIKTPKAKVAKPTTRAPENKYAAYEAAVLKYDAEANPAHIKKIVDHLGVALKSRDGKFVACSDPAERETVAKSWLQKKLGVEGDLETLDAKVGAVCATMKDDRMKSRVTFYYLLAKIEGQLETL